MNYYVYVCLFRPSVSGTLNHYKGHCSDSPTQSYPHLCLLYLHKLPVDSYNGYLIKNNL